MNRLNELVVFNHMIEDPIITTYRQLIVSEDSVVTKGTYYGLVRQLLANETSFQAYLIKTMMGVESPVLTALSHESQPLTAMETSCLSNDLAIVAELMVFKPTVAMRAIDGGCEMLSHLFYYEGRDLGMNGYKQFFETMDELPKEQVVVAYKTLLEAYGIGPFANNMAFYLNKSGGLTPIEHYEPMAWDHIYDYEHQKHQLYANTKALVEGRTFQHALLVGASGTGKSSSVKGVVQAFGHQKLRLIQLHKGQMERLPKLLNTLAKSAFKFILFFDDLSFEVNEDSCKLLKTYMEGGVTDVAGNIAFYVTTNRRHLIKEVRSEREGDIHLADFIQEMTSLSKRFGLTLTYEGLTQKAFFTMVQQMLEENQMFMEGEEMEVKARQWSLRNGGMSGRVARQFVADIQMKEGE